MAMIFDGKGSNQTNWFSPGRLITSPWSDLPGSHQFDSGEEGVYFSIQGNAGKLRNFYINYSEGSCVVSGWTMIDHQSGCTWAEPIRNGLKKFIYSLKKTKMNYLTDGNVGKAEVIAVFVRQE